MNMFNQLLGASMFDGPMKAIERVHSDPTRRCPENNRTGHPNGAKAFFGWWPRSFSELQLGGWASIEGRAGLTSPSYVWTHDVGRLSQGFQQTWSTTKRVLHV